jgi:glutamate dehydrogenase
VNLQAFTQNVTTVFDENYNLAATQDRKNKDIPEGGSKGLYDDVIHFLIL